MKKIIIFIAVVTLSLILGSCKNVKQERFFSSMYTTIHVELYSNDENILDEIEDIFDLYNQISTKHRRNEVDFSSPYYNYENVYTINKNAGIKPIEVVGELIELIEYGVLLYEQTDGYFHIGIGNLVDLWKNAIDKYLFFQESDYDLLLTEAENLGSIDIEKIVIDKENKTIYLKDNTIQLDLGALSKGYALNKAVELIKSRDIKKYKIDAGSSSMAYGIHPENRPYKIGIKDSKNKYQNGYIGIFEAQHTTMSTSGSSEQWLNVFASSGEVISNKMIHHIISPFTFKPENYYYSITLIGEDAGQLDAFSTAAYLMDQQTAVNFLEKNNIKYILYLLDYTIITNLSDQDFEKSELK